jgi:hypothetical protein
MPTIWDHLENVDKAPTCPPHIQVRTFLPGGIVIRVRANIVAQTLIARGTDAVDVSIYGRASSWKYPIGKVKREG